MKNSWDTISTWLRSPNGRTLSTIVDIASPLSLALFTFILALFTVLLYRATDQQMEDNRTTNAPFLFRREYEISTIKRGTTIDELRIWPVIENGGLLPIKFRIKTDGRILKKEAKQELRERIPCPIDGDSLYIGDIALKIRGPRQATKDEGGSVHFPIRDISERAVLYVAGRMVYADRFDPKNYHKTEFCDGFVFEKDELSKGNIVYDSVPTTTGNCVDSGCDSADKKLVLESIIDNFGMMSFGNVP